MPRNLLKENSTLLDAALRVVDPLFAIAAGAAAYRVYFDTWDMTTGGLFLVVVFSFTNARQWVTEQTTINRATLHIAPLAAVFAVLAFRAFAERWAAAQTPAAPARAAPPSA